VGSEEKTQHQIMGGGTLKQKSEQNLQELGRTSSSKEVDKSGNRNNELLWGGESRRQEVQRRKTLKKQRKGGVHGGPRTEEGLPWNREREP